MQMSGTSKQALAGHSWRRLCAVASVTLFGGALLLSGCTSDSVGTSDSGSQAASGDDQKAETAADLQAADGSATVDGAFAAGDAGGQREQSVAAPIPAVEREVIATAEVTLRVEDVAAAVPELTHAATSAGGYVAGEDTSTDPDDPSKTRSTLILRVPTDRLQSVLVDVRGAGDVVRTTSDTRDVTEEVVDVDNDQGVGSGGHHTGALDRPIEKALAALDGKEHVTHGRSPRRRGGGASPRSAAAGGRRRLTPHLGAAARR